MTLSNKTRRAGVAAGLWNCHWRLASDTRAYPSKISLKQAENVIDASRRFRRATARRDPVLEVRISVRAVASPYGRSQPFQLSAYNLDKLLATASSLEEA
jgi:hypothetical protein